MWNEENVLLSWASLQCLDLGRRARALCSKKALGRELRVSYVLPL